MKTINKYQAVVFDLFGTLIPNFSEIEYRQVICQMSSVVGAPEKEFWHLWKSSFSQRALGLLPDLESQIAAVCQQLNLKAGNYQIKEAARIRFEYEIDTIIPRPDAIDTLSALKARNIKIGLISDCSSEVPAIWQQTPFAEYVIAPVFSCSVGIRKPDPRIYQIALERLNVIPEECIYVGDGGSRELPGAAMAGMLALQLKIPGEDNPDVFRIDDEVWAGPAITSLSEVLNLV